MIRRLAAALVAGAVCLGGTAAPADTAVSASVWSTPRAVGGCALPQGPARVAFPQGSPTQRTGAGALVFGAGVGSCPGLAGRASVLELAPIGTGDLAGPTSVVSGSGATLGAPVVAGTTQGEVVLAAGRSSGAPGGRAVLGDAPAGAGLTVRALDALPGPLAGATAWLGDAGLVSVQRRASGAQALVLRVQRHYASSLGAPVVLPVGSGHISSLSLNMDYRSDALVSWAQNGSIYARAVSNSGRIGPTERVGSGGAAPQLSAVYSDDGRAIVAWAVQRMSGGRAPSNVPALQSLVQLDVDNARWPEAADLEKRLIATKPHPVASDFEQLAELLFRLRQEDAARSALQQCLALDPYNFKAHLYLGVLYRHEQLWTEAQEHLEFIRRFSPDADPGTYTMLYDVYTAEGQSKPAADAVKFGLRLFPGNPDLVRLSSQR